MKATVRVLISVLVLSPPVGAPATPCAMALSGPGGGHLGQLGNGTIADGLLPAAVPGLTGITAVAGGGGGYAIAR